MSDFILLKIPQDSSLPVSNVKHDIFLWFQYLQNVQICTTVYQKYMLQLKMFKEKTNQIQHLKLMYLEKLAVYRQVVAIGVRFKIYFVSCWLKFHFCILRFSCRYVRWSGGWNFFFPLSTKNFISSCNVFL